MPSDAELFQHYLDLNGPDGTGAWNVSPECLYTQWATRDVLKAQFEARPGMAILNVGIGTGDWDDFLGYWAHESAVTSLDRDEAICALFAYRQQRERHPNPSRVVHADLLEADLARASFDLVTMIGSTLEEAGQFDRMLDACRALLKPEGRLFLALFQVQQVLLEGGLFQLQAPDLGTQFFLVRQNGLFGQIGYLHGVLKSSGSSLRKFTQQGLICIGKFE